MELHDVSSDLSAHTTRTLLYSSIPSVLFHNTTHTFHLFSKHYHAFCLHAPACLVQVAHLNAWGCPVADVR